MKNLQRRGRIWWVKKMVRGVLVYRSLETTDQAEAVRKMGQVIAADLKRKGLQPVPTHGSPG
jgi:hypothetical protein